FNKAILLAKYIHIYTYKEEFLIPEFTKYIETIVDNMDSKDDELELIDTFNNETGLNRSITIGNAALEVAHHWEERKRLETLPKTQLANISDLNPLCKDVFLIIYLNRILCLEKVIAMYKKCGQQHAWVDKPVGFLDNLSYISINVYIQIANRVFSCENLVGGKIAIHITPQEIVYFL
ncbi:10792_t:CDS:2, partial [Racocetra fulgida]